MTAKEILAVLTVSLTVVLYAVLIAVSPHRASVLVWVAGFIVTPIVIMLVNDRKRGTK